MNATLYLRLDAAVPPTAASSDAGWADELIFLLNILAGRNDAEIVYLTDDPISAIETVDRVNALGLRPGRVVLDENDPEHKGGARFVTYGVDINFDIAPGVGLTRAHLNEIDNILWVETSNGLEVL